MVLPRRRMWGVGRPMEHQPATWWHVDGPRFGHRRPAVLLSRTLRPAVPISGLPRPAVPTSGSQRPSVPTSGPRRPAVPAFGPCWPTVPTSGPCWPAVPTSGPCRPAVPTSGPRWPAVPTSGPCWPAVPTFQTPRWPAVPTSSPRWPAVPTSGALRSYGLHALKRYVVVNIAEKFRLLKLIISREFRDLAFYFALWKWQRRNEFRSISPQTVFYKPYENVFGCELCTIDRWKNLFRLYSFHAVRLIYKLFQMELWILGMAEHTISLT